MAQYKFIALLLVMASLIALSTLVLAQDEAQATANSDNITIQLPDAGITPDSVFYGLEMALERIKLTLTFNKAEKAKLGLAHAEERLSELRLLIELKKLKAAEKARDEHKKLMQEVRERINEIEEDNATEEAEEKVEIEKRIREQEKSIELVDNEIKVKIRGNLTAEQQILLDNLIASFRNSTAELKIEIKAGIGKTKIKIKQETRESEEEIDSRIERIREEKGITELCGKRNRLLVKELEKKIEKIEERLEAENLSGINTTALQQILEQLKEIKGKAELKLEEKEQACDEAEKLAENAKEISDDASELEEKGTANAAESISNIIEKMNKMQSEGVKGINTSRVIQKLTAVRESLREKADMKEQVEKAKERQAEIKEKLKELKEVKEEKRVKAAREIKASIRIKEQESESGKEEEEGERTIQEAVKPTTQMSNTQAAA